MEMATFARFLRQRWQAVRICVFGGIVLLPGPDEKVDGQHHGLGMGLGLDHVSHELLWP